VEKFRERVSLEGLFTPGRRNSIGFLRFLLASLVVLSHSFRLGGLGAEPLLQTSGETLGTLSVDCFFVLSGFLIARSYTTSLSVWRYLWHRVLRIFPAYWACLCVIAFGFGPLLFRMAGGTLEAYLASTPSPHGYVVHNAFLHVNQPGIDGLLRAAPFPVHLDGPLWSLEHEFRCYIGLALVGVCGLFGRWAGVGRVVLGLVVLALFVLANVPGEMDRAGVSYTNALTLRLAVWFGAGVLFYVFARHVPMRAWFFALALCASVLALRYGQQRLVGPLATSYVLFYLVMRLPLTWWDRRGDFSYGLYIYAFPVQQTLAMLGVPRRGVLAYFAASMAIATALAVVSWYAVERPLLRLKHLGARKASRRTEPA